MTYEFTLTYGARVDTIEGALALKPATPPGLKLESFAIYETSSRADAPSSAPEVTAPPKPEAAAAVTTPAAAATVTTPASAAPGADATALRTEVRDLAKSKMEVSAENKVAIKALLTAAGVDSLGKLPDAALATFKAAVGAL